MLVSQVYSFFFDISPSYDSLLSSEDSTAYSKESIILYSNIILSSEDSITFFHRRKRYGMLTNFIWNADADNHFKFVHKMIQI